MSENSSLFKRGNEIATKKYYQASDLASKFIETAKKNIASKDTSNVDILNLETLSQNATTASERVNTSIAEYFTSLQQYYDALENFNNALSRQGITVPENSLPEKINEQRGSIDDKKKIFKEYHGLLTRSHETLREAYGTYTPARNSQEDEGGPGKGGPGKGGSRKTRRRPRKASRRRPRKSSRRRKGRKTRRNRR